MLSSDADGVAMFEESHFVVRGSSSIGMKTPPRSLKRVQRFLQHLPASQENTTSADVANSKSIAVAHKSSIEDEEAAGLFIILCFICSICKKENPTNNEYQKPKPI